MNESVRGQGERQRERGQVKGRAKQAGACFSPSEQRGTTAQGTPALERAKPLSDPEEKPACLPPAWHTFRSVPLLSGTKHPALLIPQQEVTRRTHGPLCEAQGLLPEGSGLAQLYHTLHFSPFHPFLYHIYISFSQLSLSESP